NSENELSEYAWFQHNSNNTTHPVGLKKPNLWGIYDLHGNVAEWCLDELYNYATVQDYVEDPTGTNPISNVKIVRGGAFTHLAKECRCANRETVPINNPFNEPTGVRLVYLDTE